MNQSDWKLVSTYGGSVYLCGLMPGDLITLRRQLAITDSNGFHIGSIEPGLPWVVLTSVENEKGILWLREPSGERHTWDDNEEVFLTFERYRPSSLTDVEASKEQTDQP
jgi:hypothetical protein